MGDLATIQHQVLETVNSTLGLSLDLNSKRSDTPKWDSLNNLIILVNISSDLEIDLPNTLIFETVDQLAFKIWELC